MHYKNKGISEYGATRSESIMVLTRLYCMTKTLPSALYCAKMHFHSDLHKCIEWHQTVDQYSY